MVIVTMEFEVPKRRILRPTLSTHMAQHVLRWETQKRCSSRKKNKNKGPWHRNIIISNFNDYLSGGNTIKTGNGQT